MDEINAYAIIEQLKDMSTDSKMLVLEEIVRDDRINVTGLIVSQVNELVRFKVEAQEDMRRVSQAGVELAEREIRRITNTKGYTRKKDDKFLLAMLLTLLDAGAYKNTPFASEISEGADFSDIDKDWYESCWKPKTTDSKFN